MFCEKCGKQLPDDAVFCEGCGNRIPPAAPAPGFVPPAAPAAPKAPNPLAKFFSVKRNLFITIGAGVLLLALLIIIIVVASGPKTVKLNEYFTVEYTGANGYGRASIVWDDAKLAELNAEIFEGKQPQYDGALGELENMMNSMLSLRQFVTISVEPLENLKNGDEITLSYTTSPETFEDMYDVKLKLTEETVTVEGLTEVQNYDIFQDVTATFAGFDGFGELNIQVPEEAVTVGSYTITYQTYSKSNISVGVQTGESYYEVSYVFDKYYELKNGETITCTLSEGSQNNAQQLAERYALALPSEANSVTVEGLTAITDVDPFTALSYEYTGYSGFASMAISLNKETIAVGDYTLQLTVYNKSSSCRLEVAVLDKDGDRQTSVTYYSDAATELSENQKVTFSCDYTESLIGSYGIRLPEKKEITVTGLKKALEINPLLQVSPKYSGYTDHGTATIELKTNTVTAGNYTLKLSVTNESSLCKLVVIISNAAGENLCVMEYRSGSNRNLKNGETFTFTYSRYYGSKQTLAAIRDEYGIIFPEEYAFEISGLTALTEFDPRSLLTYNFSGDNGSITMTMSLSKTTETVGGYTVTMEVVTEESWWNTYYRLKCKVTNAAGEVLADGYYQASKFQSLSEGDTVSISWKSSQSTIEESCGIRFNSENKDIIVSTR